MTSLKSSSQSSNDGKPREEHDGNLTFLLVSCVDVRKVTASLQNKVSRSGTQGEEV